jgi:hypothetical protein
MAGRRERGTSHAVELAMNLSHATLLAGPKLGAVALTAALCGPAHAALYQCTGASGETLFTDSGCPSGYTTDLVVPEAPVPARPTAAPEAAAAPAPGAPQQTQPSDADAALLAAERENSRLRDELQQERLRAIDRKLDALLETQPTYGAVGVIPFGFPPKPFPVCGAKPGQTPWVNCRPARNALKPSNDLKPRAFRRDPGACGIAGCTPGILR